MPTHYLTLPSIGFEGGNVNVHRVFADENNTGYLTVVDSGDGIHGRVSWTQGYNYFEGCTVEIYHDGVWQPCVHLGSNFWEYTEPAGPAEQAGGWGDPYRVPCWLGSWPASRVLTMCAQHSHDSEKTVAEKCNAHRQEADPAWIDEGDCETGEEWQAGNCYGQCDKGTSTDAVTQAAETAAGETIVPLGGGCGSIVIGDRVTFGSDGRIYTVAAGAATECPTSLSGYFITLTEELVEAVPAGATVNIQERGTKDFSTCLKSGWKAVRAVKYWHGRNGWQDGCNPECDASTTHYRTAHRTLTYTQVRYPVSSEDRNAAYADYATCMEAATTAEEGKACLDAFIAAIEEVATGEPETIYDFSWERQYTVTTLGELTEDVCSDNDDDLGLIYSDTNLAALMMFGNWACGPDFSEVHPYGANLNNWFGGGVPGLEYSAAVIQETNENTELELVGASYESGWFYINTWHAEWELSNPYTLESCVTDSYELLDKWDLSDDVQYPWRPAGGWIVNEGGTEKASRIPFVRYRELGPISPDILGAQCGQDLSCSGSTSDPCPYDGGVIGEPLPKGFGPHYAFWDSTGVIATLGWNPGIGLPDTATWWTDSDEERNPEVFPIGGWVIVNVGVIYAQKWAETKDTYIGDQYLGSVNFFRPCGADDRSADYKAICGRIEIASMSLLAGTLSVTLASEASYLQTTDKIDFVSYGSSPDYAETVNNGGSKITPDTDGYIVTRTDSTHFFMTGIGSVPTATHVKSHGAPHYKWHDALRKGDFTFCVEETTCGVPSNSCEAGCLPLSSCFPAVAAVLPPDSRETFENADTMLLPEAGEVLNSYTYRVKPRIYEADPFYMGEETAPVVESRCDPPEGAPAFPSGTAYEGCGELPAFRPVLPRPQGLRGLGDAVALVAQPVAKVIDSLTSRLPAKLRTKVAQCGGCQRRKEALNRAVPFTKPLQK